MDTQQVPRPRDEREGRRGGRPPAGTDPRKRRQILDGALGVFRRTGFDAASMADIAAEARVSKATLYVYYPSKEQLFAAVVGEERDRNISTMLEVLEPEQPARIALMSLGRRILQALGRPHVIQAHRIVIGVCERMPDIGRQMFEAGPKRVCAALTEYLAVRVAAGDLAIEDLELAAQQFLEVCQAGVVRPRLYGAIDTPPGDDEIDRAVTSAVELFLARYGCRSGPPHGKGEDHASALCR
jgi:TetR/AcrR family transcriptional regulator of autoinduction and epiphytic fitness